VYFFYDNANNYIIIIIIKLNLNKFCKFIVDDF